MAKKILALLMAVALIFSISAIVVFSVDYRPQASGQDATLDTNVVKIKKTYKLENDNTISPAETFYLIQTDSKVTESLLTAAPALATMTDAGYTGTAPLVGKIFFDEGDATKAGTTKEIDITLPAYNSVGVYEYTLQEIDSKTGGVIYRSDDIRLVITVMNDDQGKFYIAAVHAEEVSNTATPTSATPTDPKTDTFTNIYQAGKLEISKTVTGNMGDRDKYFDFSVTFNAEAAGINYGTAPIVAVSGGSHTSNPTQVSLKSLAVDNPVKVDFKLKHDETITFENIPYGVNYKVVEAPDEYKVTYTFAGGTATATDAAVDTVATDTQAVDVENNKELAVDTGVILQNLPYILIAVFVIAGGTVFFVIRKRRNEDEEYA